MKEESNRGRNTRAGYNWSIGTYEIIHYAKCLGIGKYEEHESAIKTVFDFEKESIEAHWLLLFLFLLFLLFLCRHLLQEDFSLMWLFPTVI